MKSLKDIITEALHEGPMHIADIIRVLHREYNISFFNAKDYPEITKFLPHCKIDDLDVAKTAGNIRCGIGIQAGSSPKSFGLGIHYISTEKSQYGDGTLKRTLDWTDMSKETLSNTIICLRKILSEIDNKVEKEYVKHPKAKDLRSEIQGFASRQTPRSFNTRNIEVSVIERELTNDDKKDGFSCIIDVEISPKNPQQRLSIGIDKNDCLKYVWQTTYGDCKKGLMVPKHLILWKDVESQIATMLQSY
jgi:hypothetical protein